MKKKILLGAQEEKVYSRNLEKVGLKVHVWYLGGSSLLIMIRMYIYRKRLFQMINDLPTIFELVTGSARQSKDQPAAHNNGSKCKSSGKVVFSFQLFLSLHFYHCPCLESHFGLPVLDLLTVPSVWVSGQGDEDVCTTQRRGWEWRRRRRWWTGCNMWCLRW